MLGRYILFNHIKTFFLILFVLIGLLYIYLIGEVFILFEEKNLKVFLDYSLNFLPISFFYISSFVVSLSFLLVFRRMLQKNMDFLVYSFGISPLKLSWSVILFSLIISSLNLVGSYKLYADSQRQLYRLERQYKKAKELESGVVRNLWLKSEQDNETRFYNFELIDLSTGGIYGFYLLRVKEGSIEELVVAQVGKWEKDHITLRDASVRNMLIGEEVKKDMSFQYVDISQIEPLAEKPEHLSLKEVFTLTLLGEKVGVNQRYYSYEMLRRVLTSMLPLHITLTLVWVYFKWRSFNFAMFSLFGVFSLHWMLLNFIRSLVENTGFSLFLIYSLYLPVPFLSLKGLYNLVKGFRV
ncbi:MAG: LptF/LptG family permease [Aquificaceae bacterium]|nr:LptF/LptG family permease [Aquificaceae bacterium]MDW8423707.1 LptF/LptG family permease [Aquificaceae bacterium]